MFHHNQTRADAPRSNPASRLFAGAAGVAMSATLGGCVIVADVGNNLKVFSNYGSEEHEIVENVDRVEFHARGTLYIVQGETKRLRLEGSDDAIASVTISERGDTLEITQSNATGNWWQADSPTAADSIFYLELPHIEAITHTGHGELNAGPMTLDSLTVTSRDQATTNFSSVNARSFVLTVSDHANVKLETLDADLAQVKASSHSDVYAHDISTLEIDVSLNDHARAWIGGKSDLARVSARDHADLDGEQLRCQWHGWTRAITPAPTCGLRTV